MVTNYVEQRVSGRRLYLGGNVKVDSFKPPRIYFTVKAGHEYKLVFNIETMDFEGFCTCKYDSYYGQGKHECRHCYAVREWVKEELRSFLDSQRGTNKKKHTPRISSPLFNSPETRGLVSSNSEQERTTRIIIEDSDGVKVTREVKSKDFKNWRNTDKTLMYAEAMRATNEYCEKAGIRGVKIDLRG